MNITQIMTMAKRFIGKLMMHGVTLRFFRNRAITGTPGELSSCEKNRE